eukprot:m.40992 g.40992  ORF g.40992 m.40992 type:complete len:450 (-) comp9728_c0_seq2:23-1372(-)
MNRLHLLRLCLPRTYHMRNSKLNITTSKNKNFLGNDNTNPFNGMEVKDNRPPDLSRPRTYWEIKVQQKRKEDEDVDIFILGNLLHARIRPVNTGAISIDSLLPYVTVLCKDGSPLVPSTELSLGTTITPGCSVIVKIPEAERKFDAAKIELSLIHDDNCIVAVNKQPGIPVIPRAEDDFDNIISALHAKYRHKEPSQDRVPYLAHRLDMDTSGVLLVSFDKKLSSRLQKQFAKRTVQKEYLAIVHGVPQEDSGTVQVPIVNHHDRPAPGLRYYAGSNGKEAVTDWEIVEKFRNFSLIRFLPHHGRTHQIRIHALFMGHPILCDYMYGGGVAYSREGVLSAENSAFPGKIPFPYHHLATGMTYDLREDEHFKEMSPSLFELNNNDKDERMVHTFVADSEGVIKRCALHAHAITFTHPLTAEEVTIRAPLPKDMEDFLALCRINGKHSDLK